MRFPTRAISSATRPSWIANQPPLADVKKLRTATKIALAILLLVTVTPTWAAFVVVQKKTGIATPFSAWVASPGANSISVTLTSNVTAGNLIAVAVSYDNNQPGTATVLNSVTDTLGNTYVIVRTILTAGPAQKTSIAYAKNVAGGANTITANLSQTVCCKTIMVHEISGADLTAPLDGATGSGQGQVNPGTGANAVTSGNLTTTVNGDYIFGVTINDSNDASLVITAGTGETQQLSSLTAAGNAMMTEDKTQATAGAIASTFKFSVSVATTSAATLQMAFKAKPSLQVDPGVASASTCAAKSVTITAKDGAGATLTTYTGTITVSTSTGNGDWSKGTASGTLTPGALNSGAATYTFVLADSGDIVLNLTDQESENLTVTVADAAAGVSTTSITVNFRDNALVITATDALGNIPVAGRDHAMKVEMYTKNGSVCSVATYYAKPKPLKVWLTLDASANPNPAGATLPSIGALASVPTALPGANNLTLNFTLGAAAFNLTTTDVGKYVLNMRDDSGTFAGAGITVSDGVSSTLTVRPFGFYVTATGNTGATTPAGTIFKSAGSNFTGIVTAVAWAAADDANSDGIPDAGSNLSDNTVLTRYTWAATLAANPTGFQPSTGTVGTVNNGAIATFTSGSATVATLQYTEVGSFTLRASATGYLGTVGADISDNGGLVVGRFTPFDFLVANNAPQFAAGCVSGAFTYIGQPFTYATAPVFTVTARNAQAGTTRNYTGTWWKITGGGAGTLTPVTQATRYTAFTGTLDTTGLPAVAGDPAIVDSGNGTGTLTFGAGTGFLFTRSAPAVVPFNADIGLSVTVKDSDNIAYAANPAHFGIATAGNGIAFTGGKAMEFGRLFLGNAIGSELLDLPIPISTQFWTAGGFVTNSADSCTTLANTPVALSNFSGNESACTTTVSPSATLSFSSGKASLKLTKPGSNKNGSVDLAINLGAASGTTCATVGVGNTVAAGGAATTWLQGNWGGSATFTVNPTARATFGQYRNTQEFIYMRENY